MRKIYRYEVPVDDEVHEVDLRGEILSVGCRHHSIVELWAWFDAEVPPSPRHFVVVGTGQSVDFPGARHVGTVLVPPGLGLVWHLIEWPHEAASTPNLPADGATQPA